MDIDLRTLLNPRHIEFLKGKLAVGEITVEDFQELLKRLMLREYKLERNRYFLKKAESFLRRPAHTRRISWRIFRSLTRSRKPVNEEELRSLLRERRF